MLFPFDMTFLRLCLYYWRWRRFLWSSWRLQPLWDALAARGERQNPRIWAASRTFLQHLSTVRNNPGAICHPAMIKIWVQSTSRMTLGTGSSPGKMPGGDFAPIIFTMSAKTRKKTRRDCTLRHINWENNKCALFYASKFVTTYHHIAREN